MERRKCPHCKVKLVVPNPVAVEVRRLYDGAAYWECLECGGAWSRKGTPLTPKQVAGLTRKDIFTL